MAKIYTTEITSESIPSDNPIHQRLFKAYIVADEYISGDVLEIGCGEGRGIELILKKAAHFTAVDKLEAPLRKLEERFPSAKFIPMDLPPLSGLIDNSYDSIVSFQVIEHIRQDDFFLREIHRVLKPGGVALITTPNRKLSLSRNPWHIREYLASELKAMALGIFKEVQMLGITGNEKVMEYHDKNRKSVQQLMRWDIFNLQYNLPSWILRVPYELLNRINRNKLNSVDEKLVASIHHEDYYVTENAEQALDLFLIVRK